MKALGPLDAQHETGYAGHVRVNSPEPVRQIAVLELAGSSRPTRY